MRNLREQVTEKHLQDDYNNRQTQKESVNNDYVCEQVTVPSVSLHL